MNRNQEIKHQVARFLGLNYQISDGNNKVNLLEMYESYQDFIRDNATGYQMSINDLAKELIQVYPSAAINDDKSISGITKKVYQATAPIIHDHLGEAITGQLRKMMRYTKESFTAAEVASGANLDATEVESWLQRCPLYFYNPHSNKWIRGD